jgi:DivIVA protein
MDDFLRRLFNSDEPPKGGKRKPVAPSAGEVRTVSQTAKIGAYSLRTKGRDTDMDEPRHPTAETAPGAFDDSPPDTASYAQFGEEVVGVLTSAQQAAEQIRVSARDEAERVKAEANEQARATIAEAKREVDRIRRESEQVRAEADRYAKETRETADRDIAELRRRFEAETAKKRTELDQDLREVRRTAEQRAKELETVALQRQRALVQEASRSEARLEQLVGVFRGMTAQLEELVHAEREVKASEEEPAGEPLVDALKPQRAPNERS